MNYQGSCVAIYSSHSYPNILKVVSYLRTVDYSDKQLSVMGRRNNIKTDSFGFLGLFKSLNRKNTENYFWDKLRELLKGKVRFQTSDDYSIDISGGLSQPRFKKNLTKKIHVSYSDVASLLYFVGIPKVSFEHYKTVLKNGQLLLIIHGNYQELKRAAKLLDLSGNINVSLHLSNTS